MLRVLLLEDSDVDAALIGKHLGDAGLECALRRVGTREAFEAALAEGEIALVIAEYALAGFEGLAALHSARSARPDVPFVFVSGTAGEEVAVEALKLGATDYVPKRRLELLAPAVQRALREAEVRRQSERATTERAKLLARERVARAEAEQALRHMEETLALVDALFSAAPVGLAFLDPELRCGRINERLAALSGRSPEEHVGRRFRDMIPQLGPEMERLHRQVLETGAAVVDVEVTEETPAAGAEWRTWLSSCYPVRRSDGTLFGVGTIVVDVTERKRKEEVLQRLTQRLQTLHETDRAVLRARSTADIAQAAVAATRRLLGADVLAVTRMDLERREAWLLAAAFDRDPSFRLGQPIPLKEVGALAPLEGGMAMRIDLAQDVDACPAREDMQAHGIRWLVRVPLNAEGGLIGTLDLGSREPIDYDREAMAVAQEIAAQLALAIHQAELRERLQRRHEELERLVEQRTHALQHANQELEAFAYTVSHDLRAPLRAMEGFSQALIEDHSHTLDAEGQEYARRIGAAAARLDTLINDILAYSRLSRSELRLEPVAVDDVVREALARISPDLRGGAALSVDTHDCSVLGNKTTLVQAVTNLLDNAFKFVAAGKPASVAVSAENRDGRVRLSVEDGGIGILPAERERIFRVFERLHGIEAYPGTGIGLAIVKKAAERMGGRVGVEASASGGSLFWIELQGAAS